MTVKSKRYKVKIDWKHKTAVLSVTETTDHIIASETFNGITAGMIDPTINDKTTNYRNREIINNAIVAYFKHYDK